MGIYLNNSKARTLYRSIQNAPYFVDKSEMLSELIPAVEGGGQYICITRPRRFGKTVVANMISSFFGKVDSTAIFETLAISKDKDYKKHLNSHNVITISFNELPRKNITFAAYIERIERILLNDLREAYPTCRIHEEDALWDVLNMIHEKFQSEQFIFVFDEWDYIFHRDFVTEEDKKNYIAFLRNLLKDQPYVEMAYMTGILPIAKYSSGSELNMFAEYTMSTQRRFGDYFGFTETEVDMLFDQYQTATKEQKVTREGLRAWYDGYHTLSAERLYNPRSVVLALVNNQLGDYWTSSGPYDEINLFGGKRQI